MSIIKKSFILLLGFWLCGCSAQETVNNKTIYADVKDSIIENYSINKDSSSFAISFYINGFESESKRQRIKKHYAKNNMAGKELPDFSVQFVSFTKPEHLKDLNGLNYIPVAEYLKKELHAYNPTYIIVRLKDGSFLSWKASVLSPE